MSTNQPPLPSFAEATRLWLKIGLIGFGGPAGQIALMHRLLVDEKRWIGEARFLHALNYCMLLPGPEAQQLATYVGWLLHRTAGGLVAGILFVLPGFAVIVTLSLLYALYQDLELVQALFFGVKAAVLAVVVEALVRIGRRALKTRAHLILAGIAFAAIFAFAVPFPAIVLAAGLIGAGIGRWRPAWFLAPKAAQATVGAPAAIDALFEGGRAPDHTRPDAGRALRVLLIWLAVWFGPVLLLAGWFGAGSVFVAEGLFFSKMAVVTFGGAYAVLAYVAQQAVEVQGWLAPGEMLDGLGLAETTPGPLILVLTFVGFLGAFRAPGALDPVAAGLLGAVVTTWATFAPCFLWIFLGAPYVEALRGNRPLAAALSAITAAVVGVILNLAVWFGLHVIFARQAWIEAGPLRLPLPDWTSLDPAAAVLAAGAMIATLRFKTGMIPTLAVCALLGAGWFLWGR